MSDEKFSYTYQAPTEEERKEIESIRSAYNPAPRTQTPLQKLRALDKKIRRTALVVALLLGIGGSLLFGTGFALFSEWGHAAVGICVGIAGALCMALAYPVHRRTLRTFRKNYGEEIERLSKEALGE